MIARKLRTSRETHSDFRVPHTKEKRGLCITFSVSKHPSPIRTTAMCPTQPRLGLSRFRDRGKATQDGRPAPRMSVLDIDNRNGCSRPCLRLGQVLCRTLALKLEPTPRGPLPKSGMTPSQNPMRDQPRIQLCLSLGQLLSNTLHQPRTAPALRVTDLAPAWCNSSHRRCGNLGQVLSQR